MNDFETWWYHEGSGPPLPGEDGEEHCKRMCQIAWSNGAYKAREVLDSLLDEAKLLADDRPVEAGNLSEWALDAEHMIRRLVKAFNSSTQSAQQEPFGYFKAEPFGWTDCAETDEGAVALYQRPKDWVNLTDVEIESCYGGEINDFARAIEAKSKEKNQ